MSDRERQTDVLVPYIDVAAEASVLSAVLIDPDALPKVIDFLRPEHFGSEAHRRIFEAAVEVFRDKDPVDPQTVSSELRARGRIGQVGGTQYIASILDASPVVQNVRAHAVSVHDAARRRQVMLACQKIAIQAATSVADVQAWCESNVRTLGEIALENPVRPVESCEQALARVLADALLDQEAPPEPGTVSLTGFPMGLHGLDRILGGLRKSAKTTIAATTGIGKTAFAIQASVALAKQGIGVLFFSKELKRDEVMRRALLQESGVSANRIKERRLTRADREALRDANDRLKNLPIIVDETPKLTIEQMTATSKATTETMLHRFRVPLGMIVDDYVQRGEPSPHLARRDEREQLGHHSKHFKILCQELDTVGLELAQAKDPVHGRKPEKPRGGAGIWGSSVIGKESDDIVYLEPDADAGGGAPNDPRTPIVAWVAKNRAGPKNIGIGLVFRGDTYRFSEPNAPDPLRAVSRQYVDPLPEPPPGRFDDEDVNPLTEGL